MSQVLPSNAPRALLLLLACVAAGCQADPPEPRFYREKPSQSLARAEAEKPAPEPAAEPAPPPQPMRPMARTPTSPDPLGGAFGLDKALADLPGKGPVGATIDTSLGKLQCKLFEGKAPLTVANFVGLARGLRPFWDAKADAWVTRPLYDGTTFHRVIPGFVIQGGDHMGNGTGDVGFNVPDEIWPGSKHDRAGLLCMANKGPNTNGGQFFITDAAAPHLTQMKSYTIFGECAPVDVVHKIANAPTVRPGSERPSQPVEIRKVTIHR